MSYKHPIHCVDESSRARAEMARLVFSIGYHAEVYGSLDELVACDPADGLVFIRDDCAEGGLPAVANALQLAECTLPLVALSAASNARRAVDAIKAGALDYISLPIAPEDLAQKLTDLTMEAEMVLEQRRLQQDARERLEALSPRERDVVEGLSRGLTNKEIARELGISPRTVEIHRANMKGKLGARHSNEAVRLRLTAQRA